MFTLLLLDYIVRIIVFCCSATSQEGTNRYFLATKERSIHLSDQFSLTTFTYRSSLVTFARMAEMVSPFICAI